MTTDTSDRQPLMQELPNPMRIPKGNLEFLQLRSGDFSKQLFEALQNKFSEKFEDVGLLSASILRLGLPLFFETLVAEMDDTSKLKQTLQSQRAVKMLFGDRLDTFLIHQEVWMQELENIYGVVWSADLKSHWKQLLNWIGQEVLEHGEARPVELPFSEIEELEEVQSFTEDTLQEEELEEVQSFTEDTLQEEEPEEAQYEMQDEQQDEQEDEQQVDRSEQQQMKDDKETIIASVGGAESITQHNQGIEMNAVGDSNNMIDDQVLLAIVDDAVTNTMVANLDEDIIYVNNRTVKVLTELEDELAKSLKGFRVKEVVGESIHRYHKDPEAIKRILRAMSVGESHIALIHPGELTFEFTARVLGDAEGNKIGYVVEWFNVTQKLEFENKAELLDSALEGSPQAMLTCDRDLIVNYANPSTMRLMEDNLEEFQVKFPGFQPSKLIGSCIDMFHTNPAHQRRLLSDETNLPYTVNIEVGALLIELNVSANRDASGAYIGNTLSWTNITELVQEKNTTARLNSSLDGQAQAILNCDRDLKVTYANPSTIKLMTENLEVFQVAFPGFSVESLMGSCIDRFHKHPEHQRRLLGNADNLPYQTDISVGDMSFNLNVSAMRDAEGNYIGNTLEWADVTQARKDAEESNRLWGLIEEAKTNFMICDKDLVITYVNPAVKAMLTEYEGELRKVLPHFDVSALLGTNIDSFHVNPSHQRRILGNAANLPYSSEIKVGTLEFGLNATALTDAEGNLIGNAVEWTDYNDRAIYSSEVDRLLMEITSGNLKERGNVEAMTPVYQPMVSNINEIINAIVAPLGEIQERLGQVAIGDVKAFVTGDYQGDHALLKNALNKTLESLGALAEAASSIADGDLTINVTPKSEVDAMGISIEKIINNLNSLMGQVQKAVNQITNGSEQIASSSQSLAQGATEQASSLEEVSASMTELASQTVANAENANQANTLANAGRDSASQGDEQMKEMITAMSTIEDSSTNISKIIKVIDEIAFQTNLLALNAAVEAARAGVHGKGFAVVANEVRNLAGRSAQAAKETTEMIEDSAKKVRQGIQIADKTAEALTEIVDNVSKVSDLVGEIAAASKEQAEGINQINTGLNQIEQVTQQNTASSEQSAAAAEELAREATHLKELISKFSLKAMDELPQLPTDMSPEMMRAMQQFLQSQGFANGGHSLPQAKAPAAKMTIDHDHPTTRAAAKIRPETIKSINPEDAINLEDSEFGRY